MGELRGGSGELRATITVKRKATGLEETFELVGTCSQEEAEALGAEVITAPRIHGAAGALAGEGSKLTQGD